jgi:hypothetical protein
MATSTTWLSGWPAVRAGRRVAADRGADVRAVPLVAGERVLAARDLAGTRLVATDRAVYRMDWPGQWARLGWEQVGHVDWDERQGLVLTGWAPEAPARMVLAVLPRDPLVALACERVGWTTVMVTRVAVGGGDVGVVVRRQPGSDHLLWMVNVEGTAVNDPEMAAALAKLRAELGR